MVRLKRLGEGFFIYTVRCESKIITNFTDMLDKRHSFDSLTVEEVNL